jgi:hypothetical protein
MGTVTSLRSQGRVTARSATGPELSGTTKVKICKHCQPVVTSRRPPSPNFMSALWLVIVAVVAVVLAIFLVFAFVTVVRKKF